MAYKLQIATKLDKSCNNQCPVLTLKILRNLPSPLRLENIDTKCSYECVPKYLENCAECGSKGFEEFLLINSFKKKKTEWEFIFAIINFPI